MNSPIESEIKFVLTDDAAVRLREALESWPDIEKAGRVYEKSTMFDDERGRMQARDARLRVRQVGGPLGPSGVEFAYKRRLASNGPIKREEELELAYAGDPEPLVAILDRMGYLPTTSYERYRTTYRLGGLKLTLDEFPFGCVLEIEGADADIASCCARLSLVESASTLESCDDVYERLCREQGAAPRRHIEFADTTMPHVGRRL